MERLGLIYVKWQMGGNDEHGGVMAWHGWESDPMTDGAAADVLAAFEGRESPLANLW